ncbi:MAG: VWA domain-containing protein [Nitrospinota bacterium]
MSFAHPLFFLLLIPLFLVWRQLSKKRNRGRILFPGVRAFQAVSPSRKVQLKAVPQIFRYTALTLLVITLARPQVGKGEEEVTSKGIDIILAIDVSGSMSTSDIDPTRLEGAKKVALSFVDKRRGDRVGLVVFAGNSFTQSPLTLDYPVLSDLIESLHIGMTEDGTAIGMALATSVNRLRESDAKSRIIILLTDGVNNRGAIDPETAAGLARATGIKVYTVAVGKEGVATRVIDDPLFGKRKVSVRTVRDEETLKKIAAETGANYYRATNLEELQNIYDEIDSLEKVEIKTKYYMNYQELFPWFLYPALLLFGAEVLLEKTVFRRFP